MSEDLLCYRSEIRSVFTYSHTDPALHSPLFCQFISVDESSSIAVSLTEICLCSHQKFKLGEMFILREIKACFTLQEINNCLQVKDLLLHMVLQHGKEKLGGTEEIERIVRLE